MGWGWVGNSRTEEDHVGREGSDGVARVDEGPLPRKFPPTETVPDHLEVFL